MDRAWSRRAIDRRRQGRGRILLLWSTSPPAGPRPRLLAPPDPRSPRRHTRDHRRQAAISRSTPRMCSASARHHHPLRPPPAKGRLAHRSHPTAADCAAILGTLRQARHPRRQHRPPRRSSTTPMAHLRAPHDPVSPTTWPASSNSWCAGITLTARLAPPPAACGLMPLPDGLPPPPTIPPMPSDHSIPSTCTRLVPRRPSPRHSRPTPPPRTPTPSSPPAATLSSATSSPTPRCPWPRRSASRRVTSPRPSSPSSTSPRSPSP